jgi:hypothetical protein
MHSVALTLGWELWRRHRFWFVLTAAYLAAAAGALRVLALGEMTAPAALVAVAPLGAAAVLLLGFFTYSLDMDLLAPGSGFPGRAFTLPVRTAALAGWPMLFGSAATALLWLAAALLILRPAGLAVPLAWPALLAAALTAWTQALVWWPVGWPWLRTAAVVLLVMTFGLLGPRAWSDFDLPERAAVPVLGALLLGAYAAGVAGVARARRGAGQAWPSPWQWALGLWARTRRPRPPFASPGAALVWWEWRRNGRVLALLSAFLLPWFVPVLLLPENPVLSPANKWGGFLLLPLVVGLTAGAGMGHLGAPGGDRKAGMPSFLATRPVGGTAFIAAKLKGAALCTLAIWVPPYLLGLLILFRPGNGAEVEWLWGHLLRFYPPWKAGLVVALGAVALPALTWKGMVENLAFGLSGRPRVIRAAVLAFLALAVGGSMAVAWLAKRPDLYEPLRRLAWWAAAVAVALKLLLAGWAVRALRRRRLVAPRALAGWLAAWPVLVAGLFAALAWLVPPGVASLPALALAAVLLVPLARPALAPLALAWDRHR